MRDIQRQQRNKLRNTSTYTREELKSAINGEFGSAKLTIPIEILMGEPKDGLTLEQRATTAIGSYFGPSKVTYVNKKSRVDNEPTGQVSIRIGMLSPEGAVRLARGYRMWPGEKQPRGFYVDITHVIEANSLITLPMYTNSWRITWRSLPSGILSDGEVRELFYIKMPQLMREEIIELESNHNNTMRLDPATGEEMEQEGGITLIQYWDQWAKQEKWTIRYFPPYTIDSGPGYGTTVSHIGRRPNYKDARFDPAAVRLEFPPAFRAPMKKAAEKAAKVIGGEGWEIRARGYVYPEPALSTLKNFPVTIVQSKKKPTPVPDPRKTAVRIVVTPRRKLPEGELLITHPVEIGRWIEDTQDVHVVAIAREAPVPVSLPAEKIEASAYVFFATIEGLMPHKQLQLAEPSNQAFTRRISLWNSADARDKVRINKEVFSVSRELACLPQELAEEAKEVTSQDVMRSMMQVNFKTAMEQGREESGSARSIITRASEMFKLDALGRNADIDDQVRILQKAEAERQARADQAMVDMMEDLERQKAHKLIQDGKAAAKAAAAKPPSPGTPNHQNKPSPHQPNTEPFLHVVLMPSERVSLITISSTASKEGTPPNLVDLAKYITQSMEMGPNVGCSNESIQRWTTKQKKDRAPIKIQIKLGEGSDTRTYDLPDNSQAASLVPLMPLFIAQGKTPGTNTIRIVAKVNKADKKANKTQPDWMYAKAVEEEWSVSPAPKRPAARESEITGTPMVANGNLFANLEVDTQPHNSKQSKVTHPHLPTENCCRTKNITRTTSSSPEPHTRQWAKTSRVHRKRGNSTRNTCASLDVLSTMLLMQSKKNTGTKRSNTLTKRSEAQPPPSNQSQEDSDWTSSNKPSESWCNQEPPLQQQSQCRNRGNQYPTTLGSSTETRVNLTNHKSNKSYYDNKYSSPPDPPENPKTNNLTTQLRPPPGGNQDEEALTADNPNKEPRGAESPGSEQKRLDNGTAPGNTSDRTPTAIREPVNSKDCEILEENTVTTQFNKPSTQKLNSPHTTLPMLAPLPGPTARNLQLVCPPKGLHSTRKPTHKPHTNTVALLLRTGQVLPQPPHCPPSLPQQAIVVPVQIEKHDVVGPTLNQTAVKTPSAQDRHISQAQVNGLQSPCTHHPETPTLSRQTNEHCHRIPPPSAVRETHSIQMIPLHLAAIPHEVALCRPNNEGRPRESPVKLIDEKVDDGGTRGHNRTRKQSLLTQVPLTLIRNCHPGIVQTPLPDRESTQLVTHSPADHVHRRRLPGLNNQPSSELHLPPLLTTALQPQMLRESTPLIAPSDPNRIPAVPALPDTNPIPRAPHIPRKQQERDLAKVTNVPDDTCDTLHHSDVTVLKTTDPAERPGDHPNVREKTVRKDLVKPIQKNEPNVPPAENRCLNAVPAVRPGEKPNVPKKILKKELVKPPQKNNSNVPPSENRCLSTTSAAPKTHQEPPLRNPHGPVHLIQW